MNPEKLKRHTNVERNINEAIYAKTDWCKKLLQKYYGLEYPQTQSKKFGISEKALLPILVISKLLLSNTK